MYNKVIIVGNLTREPEMKYLPSGAAVVSCGIATTHKYKDKEDTLFIDFTLFGKQAEIFNQYLKKGSKVLIEGRLSLDQWVDQSGQKKSKHKIVVESFKMLDIKPAGNQTSHVSNQSTTKQTMPPEIDVDDDEIPF